MSQSKWERERARRITTALAGATLIIAAVAGCALSADGLLQSPQQRHEAADAKIASAVDALKTGNGRQADALLADAARLRDKDDGPGSGAVYVAKHMVGLGRPQDAARLLTNVTQDKNAEANPQLWAALADAQRKAGNSEEASRADQEAERQAAAIVAQASTSSETRDLMPRLLRTGFYYADKKRGASAIGALRQAYRLAPNDPIVLNALGYTLADLGTTRAEYAEAVRLTRQVADQYSEVGIFLDSFGWALFKNGDLAGARRVLTEAVSLEPGEAELRCHLGQVYAALHMNEEATRELDCALRLEPGHEEAETARKALPTATPSPTATPPPGASTSPSASPLVSPTPAAYNGGDPVPLPTPQASPSPVPFTSPSP